MAVTRVSRITQPSAGDLVIPVIERANLDPLITGIQVSNLDAEITAATAAAVTQASMAAKLAVTTAVAVDGAIAAGSCDGRRVTNTGATGTVTATLPAATVGLHLFLTRLVAQTFRADPAGSEIVGTGGAGKYIELGTTGAYAELLCVVAGTWSLRSSNGTITYEP